MGEFSDDDDDFNNFDLGAAIASAKQQPYQPPSQQQTGATPSFRNTNISHEPSNNMQVDGGSATKRSSTNPYNTTTPGSNKKLKSTESSANNTSNDQPSSPPSDLNDNDDKPIVPETFKTSMTSTLTNHFGLSTFRSGQLNVLYSLLDGAGKDTCVFWATG